MQKLSRPANLLLTLQLQASPIHASHGFILSLFSIRLLSGTVTLYLLLRGGPSLVWTTVPITQARLLPPSLSPHHVISIHRAIDKPPGVLMFSPDF